MTAPAQALGDDARRQPLRSDGDEQTKQCQTSFLSQRGDRARLIHAAAFWYFDDDRNTEGVRAKSSDDLTNIETISPSVAGSREWPFWDNSCRS